MLKTNLSNKKKPPVWFIFPNSTLNVFFLFSVQVAGLFAWFKGLQRKTALTFGVELHHRRRKRLYLLSTNATVKLFAALHPPLFLHLFLLFLFISSLSFSSSLLVTFGIFYFPPSCHVCCLPTLYSPSTEGLLCCRHVTHINPEWVGRSWRLLAGSRAMAVQQRYRQHNWIAGIIVDNVRFRKTSYMLRL